MGSRYVLKCFGRDGAIGVSDEAKFLRELLFYEFVSHMQKVETSHHTYWDAIMQWNVEPIPRYYPIDSNDPSPFIPPYHGVIEMTEDVTQTIQSIPSDILPLRCIVLDNLTGRFRHPCVIDIKIGRQTFNSCVATADKRWKEFTKCAYQINACFRISGMILQCQYMDSDQCQQFCSVSFGKELGRADCVSRNQLKSIFGYFLTKFSFDSEAEAIDRTQNMIKVTMASPECYICPIKTVFRRDVLKCVVKKLKEIEQWAASQSWFTLTSSSILIAYDAVEDDMRHESDRAEVKIIDFAHSSIRNIPSTFATSKPPMYEIESPYDVNFYHGVASVVDIFSEL